MKKKPRKQSAGILVKGVLIPITDPAEQAELDRRFRAADRAIEGEAVVRRKPRTRHAK